MQRELKHLRYVLYVRKSTDTEDKQIQSLGDQVKSMKAAAERDGLRIVRTVRESKSAKRPYVREKFERLIKDVEDGKINGIVCWKIDRLSRNPTDSGRLQQILQDEKLKHILTAERSYFPEDNALVLSVETGMSNQYIRDLSTNTKRGMSSKAVSGGKNGIPPIGYLNDKAEKTIVNDPKQFNLVRTLWDKMLTGTYTVSEITRVADKELHIIIPKRKKTGGKAPAYSTICAMFKNPFYYGKIRFNGEMYNGTHIAMVTYEEFEKVQRIIDPGHAARPKDTTYNFQLRHLFKCGECGFAITAEQKHKKLKKTGEKATYIYYHCTGKSKTIKCHQPSLLVTEEKLLQQVKDKLNKFTIDPDFYELAIEVLAQEEDEVVAKDQTKTQARDNAIKRKKTSINNLRRMRYTGEASDDSWYFAEIETLESELEELQNIRNEAEYKAHNWRSKADEVFTLARYAKEDFDSDDLEKKRAVVIKLGESLTILDRNIQFTPNKYFIPLEKMNENKVKTLSEVITKKSPEKSPLKCNTTPVGSYAIPDTSTSLSDLDTSWLPVPVTDFITGVNGTNETQNDYGKDCLIIHGQKTVNMTLAYKQLEQSLKLSDVENMRLARYFDCLLEMDFDMKASLPS